MTVLHAGPRNPYEGRGQHVHPVPRRGAHGPGVPPDASRLAEWQRSVGNRATGRLLGGPHGPGGHGLALQRCGDDEDCGCATTPEASVQRDVFDDVAEAASGLVDDVGDAASGAADTVSGAASEVADAASEAMDAAGKAVSDTVDSAGAAISGAVDSAGAAVSHTIDAAGNAVSDVAGGALATVGGEALGLANGLAARWGGKVSVVGTAIVIELPEIPVAGQETTPLWKMENPPSARLPFFVAGADLGPVVLLGDLAVEVNVQPEIITTLGPAVVRNAKVVLDPLSLSATATGQLHAAASTSSIVPVEAGIDLDVLGVILAGEVPIPVEADAFGGLRLALRTTALGTLDETVDLGYRDGELFLDLMTDLKLGARLDAELDATVELSAYRHVVCAYTWPLAEWPLRSGAAQIRFPVSLGYDTGSGEGSFDAGPPTFDGQFPVDDIEARIPRLPRSADCSSLDRLIEVLCEERVIPEDLCKLKGHGGQAEFEDPAVDPDAPQSTDDADATVTPAAGDVDLGLTPGSIILARSTAQRGGRQRWFRGEVERYDAPGVRPDPDRVLVYTVQFPDQPLRRTILARIVEADMTSGDPKQFRRYADPIMRDTLRPFLAHPLLNVGPNKTGSVPATGPAVTPQQRRIVQDIGDADGCHMGQHHTPGGEAWVADHQRPTALRDLTLVESSPWDLYPMCRPDSNQQGPLVRRIVRMYTGEDPGRNAAP